MSSSCNISNSSRPWGSSDEIAAITDACSNHTRDCVKTCLLPETVYNKARQQIGTIKHIGLGAHACVYHWKPNSPQNAIPECAIRYIINAKKNINQPFVKRASDAQKKLKDSVFALPVYHEESPISFMPLLKEENLFMNAIPSRGLSFYEFSDFLQELFQALRDLRAENLVHADLSSVNCNWNPKACRRFTHFDYDFTASLEEVRQLRIALGICAYRSPEAWDIACNKYSYSIDMWSAGCLAYQALRGQSLFRYECTKKIALSDFEYYLTRPNMARNVRESVSGKQDLSPLIADRKAKELSDLMSKMLKIEPEERITPEAALQHPFFRAPDTMEEFAESFPPHISALIKEYSASH